MKIFDLAEHADAISAVLSTAIDSDHVYEFGRVPGTNGDKRNVPDLYVVFGVYRTPVGDEVRRMSGETDHTAWELELSHAGRTIRESGWLYAKVSAALDDQVLTIGQEPVGPVQFVTDDLPDLQQGRWIGRSTWAYGL